MELNILDQVEQRNNQTSAELAEIKKLVEKLAFQVKVLEEEAVAERNRKSETSSVSHQSQVKPFIIVIQSK